MCTEFYFSVTLFNGRRLSEVRNLELKIYKEMCAYEGNPETIKHYSEDQQKVIEKCNVLYGKGNICFCKKFKIKIYFVNTIYF